jgi:hypothetical protein
MSDTLQLALIPANDLLRETPVTAAPNGIRHSIFGDHGLALPELQRVLGTIPPAIAAALQSKIYFFVPLAIAPASRAEEGDTAPTMIAPAYTVELGDQAICHRNVDFDDKSGEAVFISTRLHPDRFALAFEFFINVAHGFADTAGVPEGFSTLVWQQARANVRGETSQDAWEARAKATENGYTAPDEKAKTIYLEATFADALAIYLLSLSLDFNYHDLREREYPLLAPQPLADRLREMNKLFPPNPGYEFAIRYRRRA